MTIEYYERTIVNRKMKEIIVVELRVVELVEIYKIWDFCEFSN